MADWEKIQLWSNRQGIYTCEHCARTTHLLWKASTGRQLSLHLECAYELYPHLDSSREQA